MRSMLARRRVQGFVSQPNQSLGLQRALRPIPSPSLAAILQSGTHETSRGSADAGT